MLADDKETTITNNSKNPETSKNVRNPMGHVPFYCLRHR